MAQLGSGTFVKSSGLALNAKPTTIAALTADDVCTYVQLKGLEITEIYDNNGQYASPNVTFKDTDGKEASYKIVGSQESDPMHGIISEESPFGKAFLGAKEGQDVVVEAPFGNIHYTVVKIEH